MSSSRRVKCRSIMAVSGTAPVPTARGTVALASMRSISHRGFARRWAIGIPPSSFAAKTDIGISTTRSLPRARSFRRRLPASRPSPPGEPPISGRANEMTSELSERLERCYTAAIHDVMRARGLTGFVLPWEIRPLFPATKIAGPAFTFRGLVRAGIAPHDTYLAWTRFLSDIPAGSIGVCQPNDHTVAHMGELSAETLKRRGIKGYVVDGGCR